MGSLIRREGLPFAIIEALRLRFLNREYLNTHINKALTNYDQAGCPHSFIVVYAQVNDFADFWNKLLEHVKNYQFPYPTEEALSECDVEQTEVRVAKLKFSRSERPVDFRIYAIHLPKDDIRLLKRPIYCRKCGGAVINILFMKQEGDCQTRIDVLQQCDCAQNVIYTEYYDLSVYYNYIGLINRFDNEIAEMQENGNTIEYQRLVDQEDFYIANYLSNVRDNRMGLPIIHAVGVKTWKWLDKHDGELVYKIIWKERGTERYIEDEYEIFDEHTGL